MSEKLADGCVIHFEDADMQPEYFTSYKSAAAAFDALKDNWSCHLFVNVARFSAAETERDALRRAIRKRIDAWCRECREGRPVSRNSLNYFSHHENGNHCNSHVFHELLAEAE